MAIITISRGSFSGGKSLAECAASKLGYSCISREVLVDAAVRRYDVPEQKLHDALTKKPGLLDHLTREKSHYLMCLRAALVRMVKDERVMYHGHAGHLLLKGVPHLLRVRVIASMEFRIKAVMEDQHSSKKEAIEYIEKVDEERSKWTKFLYHEDWNDSSLYDLVLNIDQLGIADACEVVCCVANMEQYIVTPDSQKLMDNLVLSTEVRGVIACDAARKGVADAGVEIEADDGMVTISGTVASLEEADRIRELISSVPSVKAINSRIEVWPHW
ncbi:MAG: cytidylate kinase family protein [Bacteroidetes bacterium]|nr:cytidylate kinase family protein [Bacteroidota bacterium]